MSRNGGGNSCGMRMVASYLPDGTVLSEDSGRMIGPVCYNSHNTTTEGNRENRPHENGNSHICGYGENGKTIYQWTDGSFTVNGKIVDDPRKDTNMDTETVLTLPAEPTNGARVKVASLTFEKVGTGMGSRWQRVGGTSRFTWAELFGLDGGKVTVLPANAALDVVRQALTDAGVFAPEFNAKAVVKALNDSTKVDLVERGFKVGERIERERAAEVEADERVTQVTDRDGDTWSRTRDGKWALREEVNEQAEGENGRLAIYSPLVIKTVK